MSAIIGNKKMEHELIMAVLEEKDKEAFNKLFALYKKPLSGMIYKMTHDFETTEKLLTRVKNKIYLSLGEYQENTPFTAWLFRLATHQCIDYICQERSDFDWIINRKNSIFYRRKTTNKLTA